MHNLNLFSSLPHGLQSQRRALEAAAGAGLADHLSADVSWAVLYRDMYLPME